jgi:hypothetical protein
MKKINETKQIQQPVLSIDTKKQKLVKQNVFNIVKHYPNNCYLLLSKNDFGLKRRVNVGIFNKKNNFIISEDHSLMFFNSKNNEIQELPLKDALNDYKNNFLIYPVPILFKEKNNEFILKTKKNKKTIIKKIKFTYKLGYKLGKRIKRNQLIDFDFIFINEDLYKNNNKISLKKFILLNSNPEFLVGLLAGITNDFNDKLFIQNINIYSLALILNLLGASYSVQNTASIVQNAENQFYIRFKLPLAFYRDDVNLKAYRNYGYVFENDKLRFKTFKNIKKEVFYRYKKSTNDNDFKLHVNFEHIILIPLTDIKFIKTECKEMYDFVTENRDGNSDNFAFAGTPLMKNSDGDILATLALWTPEAARDAEEKFGIKNKRNVLSQLTGKVQSWIGNDAILGLYEFTKNLK